MQIFFHCVWLGTAGVFSNMPCAGSKMLLLNECFLEHVVGMRESLSWIRMTRTARQDARRSGKEDAGHSLFLGRCLFRFYGEHNSKIRKGFCRDVT